MNRVQFEGTELSASRIMLGCRRWGELDRASAERMVFTALESGINCFDHADIYGGGAAESVFGQVLLEHPGLRDQIVLQSKCAIRKYNGHNYYDQSREYILRSVDGILRRLQTDHLDIFLLHRPDILTDPEETAETLHELQTSGKVKYFGVSNYGQAQLRLLQRRMKQKLIVDQMQISLAHAPLISAGITVDREHSVPGEGDLACLRSERIALQCWSPLQMSDGKTCFLGSKAYPTLNARLTELGKKYGASPAALAAAWLLRLPMDIQVIAGTTSPQHLKEICRSEEIVLSREDWYDLYHAAGHVLP